MKRILAILLSVTLLLSALAVLSSCSGYDSDGTLSYSAYYVGNLYDLDPAKDYTNDDATEIFNLLYEPLFNLSANGEVSPALVETYSYDEQTRKLTLTFRDTCWSDGTSVKNTDLIYAWERILSCDSSSRAASLLYDVENAYYCKIGGKPDENGNFPDGCNVSVAQVGIEPDSKDSKTVYITLNQGADYKQFLQNLTNIALTPIHQNAVESARSEASGSYWANSYAFIVTNGPFKVQDWNLTEGSFVLARNEYFGYPEDTENVDLIKYVLPGTITNTVAGLTQSNVKDAGLAEDEAAAKLAAYESFMEGLTTAYAETVFYLGDAPLDKRNGLVTTYTDSLKDSFSTYSYVFNLKNPKNDAVKNPNVRRAISYLIERTAIANALVFGKAAEGFIAAPVYETLSPDNTFAANRAQEVKDLLKHDVNEATRLLNSAGVSAATEITLLCRDTEEDIAIAEMVQTALAGKLTLKIVPVSAVYPTSDLVFDDLDGKEGETDKTLGKASAMSGMFDGIVLAYTPDEDGNLYYYEPEDIQRKNPKQYDMIAMDYQMLSTNAFAALASFSKAYSGNGIITTTIGENPTSYEIRETTNGWYSASYETTMAAAYAEKDQAKRATLLHTAEKILLTDMPLIPILSNQSFAVVNTAKLVDVTRDGYGIADLVRSYIYDYKELPKKTPDTEE